MGDESENQKWYQINGLSLKFSTEQQMLYP